MKIKHLILNILNIIVPIFIKSLIKKILLKKYIGELNINNDSINQINFFNIISKNINIHKSVIGEYNIYIRGKISIQKYSNINGPNTYLMADEINEIIIGKFCSISSNCLFIASNNHNYNKLSITSGPILNKFENLGGTIKIGNDVWIGANVTILPGIKIGNGAIIGAGSIVTKDIESYSIVVGNPAKLIKYRFNKILREKIEKSKWWDWEMEKIKENYNLNNY